MSEDKEQFIQEFADVFIREWIEETDARGQLYIDHHGSNIRMLARTIARALHEWEQRNAEIME